MEVEFSSLPGIQRPFCNNFDDYLGDFDELAMNKSSVIISTGTSKDRIE